MAAPKFTNERAAAIGKLALAAAEIGHSKLAEELASLAADVERGTVTLLVAGARLEAHASRCMFAAKALEIFGSDLRAAGDACAKAGAS